MIFVCKRITVDDISGRVRREIPCKKHLLILDPATVDTITKEDVESGCSCLYCNKRFKGLNKVVLDHGNSLIGEYFADIDKECESGDQESVGNTRELVTA